MADDQRKVFLSYRRALGAWMARSVYQNLVREGYDVFMDVESLDSGEFPKVILHQIEARPHFLIILVAGSLERTLESGDWLRREIEHALGLERNVVPLLEPAFSFESEEAKLRGKKLPRKVKELSNHNGIRVPTDYFDEAMTKLRERFLKKQVKVTVTPTPTEEKSTVQRMIVNAASAKTDHLGRDWFWSAKTPLEAPTLGKSLLGAGWEWTAVLMATGYVLQKSYDAAFMIPVQIYDGDQTSYPPFSLFAALKQDWTDFGLGRTEYYRVKAKGGYAFLDSPWSNVVKVDPPPRKTALEAPVLERSEKPGGWKWTPAPGATGYVLQESYGASFDKPTDLYNGDKTEFAATTAELLGFFDLGPPVTRSRYYRVKAKGGYAFLDSPWSNVVKVDPPPRKTALEAPVLEQSEKPGGWKWTSVFGAIGYILQTSNDRSFENVTELYDGVGNEYPVLFPPALITRPRAEPISWLNPGITGLGPIEEFGLSPKFALSALPKYYRVKAKGGIAFLDSSWSNVVKVPSE